jgi:hypothetical protein
MRTIRLIHFYLGVFFAPMIIFHAFTGVLQIFKLHESYRDIPGSQGDWIAWFSQIHKEQGPIPPPVAKPKPPQPAATADAKPRAEPSRPWKWLATGMGISLIATTLLGLYIAYNYPNRRRNFVLVVATGILIPVILLFT